MNVTESWACSTCHSINLASSANCYNCRTARGGEARPAIPPSAYAGTERPAAMSTGTPPESPSPSSVPMPDPTPTTPASSPTPPAPAAFCPRCGRSRIGTFQFCQRCRFDFNVPLDQGTTPTPQSVVGPAGPARWIMGGWTVRVRRRRKVNAPIRSAIKPSPHRAGDPYGTPGALFGNDQFGPGGDGDSRSAFVDLMRKGFGYPPDSPGPSRHRILKQLLGLWAIAYPILIILPLFSTGGTSNAGATTVGVLGMIVVGSTLFFPWIIGLIVLGVLIFVTKPGAPTWDQRCNMVDPAGQRCRLLVGHAATHIA